MPIPAELAFASIPEFGKRLRAKEFTAVELAEFFLDRLERLGPKLNAVCTLTRKLAIEQAERADKELADGKDRGPLHGIPYGAKDLLSTAGIPTSWGAGPLKEQTFPNDATVVVKLREAGAVLCAKLAMVEIAGGLGYHHADASFSGPGLNPWDKSRWSGGSSSGSGSAVGGGLVPFAIGSETWGSIMTPAGYCGIAGLRPTYGRISRQGAMALTWSMDKLGPMCRTAEDCGLVLNAIAGPDPLDPSASDRPYEYPSKRELRRPFRLGTLKDATDGVQPEVKANYQASLEVLAKDATFVEVKIPDLPYGYVAATIIDAEMSAAFEGLIDSKQVWEMTAPEDRIGAYAPQFIAAKDYINAQRLRPLMQRAMDELLSTVDAIVTPTLATIAGPINLSFRDYHRMFRGNNLGGPGNATGIPAISVPNGFGELGLPTGLQFVGRAFEENRLIALAKYYQDATVWHTKRPPEA